ncbi:hypothetical protein RvY_16703 [Ramazzottius varieornatus]|uniref:Receptor ligand binding region domain-containing protein n=1 Tax=Ramazzottius varieornatus TaxID=947166 RepID=A0A1D1VZG1_RAMVA|nr:hypothetical protein RvY_16703 [Ramazzottius varieornatus]
MTQGEHVHICFRLIRHSSMGNYHWRYGDQDDGVARTAYRTLLIVEGDPLRVPAKGTNLYHLLEGWRRVALEEFNLTYSLPNAIENFHITGAYDMMMWTAEVINELVEANRTDLLKDGTVLARRFYDRTFTTRIGNFTFDGAGAPGGRDCITGQYDDDNLTEVLRISSLTGKTAATSSIKWPSANWPPPNRPFCGYDGRDPVCVPPSTLLVAITAAVLGGTLVVTAFVLILASILYRSRLEDIWWVMPEEHLCVSSAYTKMPSISTAPRRSVIGSC